MLYLEMFLVLMVSLGESAVYATLSIVEKLTRNVPLGQQTTSMNNSAVPDRPWLDLAYQVAYIVLPGAGGRCASTCWPCTCAPRRVRSGRWPTRPARVRDPGWGSAIFAGIGVAGLAFYLGAVALGLNTQVSPANLSANWWTVPVLVLLAIKNAVLEEVLSGGLPLHSLGADGPSDVDHRGDLRRRAGDVSPVPGLGGFAGNLPMGLIFGWLFLTVLKRRVMPLVVTHSWLDIFSFLGAPLLPWLMSDRPLSGDIAPVFAISTWGRVVPDRGGGASPEPQTA